MSIRRANGRIAIAGRLLRVRPRMALGGYQVMLDRQKRRRASKVNLMLVVISRKV
jgi:hypothetical protein